MTRLFTMRIYAYVTSETCSYARAVELGSIIDGKPVSRHGDYYPWYCGKRDTLREITASGYKAARGAESGGIIGTSVGQAAPGRTGRNARVIIGMGA